MSEYKRIFEEAIPELQKELAEVSEEVLEVKDNMNRYGCAMFKLGFDKCHGWLMPGMNELYEKIEELEIERDDLKRQISEKEGIGKKEITSQEYAEYNSWLNNVLNQLGYSANNKPDNVPSINHFLYFVKNKG